MNKSEATTGAKRLLKRMDTKGWTVRVWENMGWHYSISCGGLTIWPSSGKPTSYHCLLSRNRPGSGEVFWNTGCTGDPNELVHAQLANARKFIFDCGVCVFGIEKKLGLLSPPLVITPKDKVAIVPSRKKR